jgi:preprotein translocase subunit Sss1
MEAAEVTLIVYLIIKGGMIGFLIIVLVEIVQWSVIVCLTTKR